MKKKYKFAMTPNNPRWEEFINRLYSEEGCNFRAKSIDQPDQTVWTCNCTTERPLAVAILKKMGNIDIPQSLIYFDVKHGYCDCGILINVDQGKAPE